jgi:imidazole glycerol-phosphate synthase subunit HisH
VITIIDAGISNIKSIVRGFVTQGFEVRVTDDPLDVAKADSLVLPGVGAFPKAVEVLKRNGLWRAVLAHARSGKPLLGVCLGMQLLFGDSDEHGLTEGLGLIPGSVRRFPPDRPVPHMGWNAVEVVRESPLFEGIPQRADFYFVHSYYGTPDDPLHEVGACDHGGRFTAAVRRDNVFGTQFHPEKSQDQGLRVLRNFAALNGTRD